MHRVYLFLFLFTVGITQLHGQQLTIGQMPFRLGMTMNEAVAMIHDPVYLDDGGNKSATATWIVREKHGENNYVIIGSIIFRNGRAETLERDLKHFLAKDAKDVGNALFEASQRLKRDDPTLSINTHSAFISSESGEIKIITIGTGIRRIKIVVPQTETSNMTVSEILTLTKPESDK